MLLAILVSVTFSAGCSRPYSFLGTPFEPAREAQPIEGRNWDGTRFRLGDLRGRIALIFFGYSWCPDVCPLTLSDMKQLYANLGDRAADVAVVFVSVDPERDTVDRLGEYIPAFDRRFYGIHVDAADLDSLKPAYGVIAEKRFYDPTNEAAGYSIDHTARIYLVDSEGLLRLSYAFATPIEGIQADVEHLLR